MKTFEFAFTYAGMIQIQASGETEAEAQADASNRIFQSLMACDMGVHLQCPQGERLWAKELPADAPIVIDARGYGIVYEGID